MDAVKKTPGVDRVAVIEEVDKALHAFCSTKIEQAKYYDDSYKRLWEVIDAYLMEGGKRIRPYLTIFAYKAYGGEDLSNMYTVAIAWELLHAGVLVHDDIIDRDTIRHSALNIAGTYQTIYPEDFEDLEHYAMTSALLAGDLLLAGAQEVVLRSNLSAQQKIQVCNYLNEALFCVGGGELLDVETILKPVTESSPEKIAKYKTAGYSFEYPLLCGASLAGAPESDLELLKAFGENTGILFQLVDDVLGVFGDTTKTGKPNDSDIREKKRTALILETLTRLPKKDAQRLEKLFSYSHALTDQEVTEVYGLINKTDAKQATLSQAKQSADTALNLVSKLSVDELYKDELSALVRSLITRVS